jgi:glycosyltransferase involved in cell wall biosynthesis
MLSERSNQPSLEARDLSVIIPVFNEAGIIGVTLEGIFASLNNLECSWEVIVVDDGSTDGGVTALKPRDHLRVVRHPVNMGNGASVKSGIRASRANHCVIMDGDGQHLIGDALECVKALNEYDLVIGARNFANSGTRHRNAANVIYSRLASYVAEFPILDLTSGLRAFKREKVMEIVHLFPNRFSSPTTMTLGMLRLGYPVKFLPIHVQERTGTSKIRIVQDGFRFLMIILKISTLFSPMKIFMPVSAMMFSFGALTYLFFLLTEQRFSMWSVVMLTNAITIFMIGLVAEEISQLKLKNHSGL